MTTRHRPPGEDRGYGEGSVYEDASGQWFASLYREGKRITRRAKSKRDAQAIRVRLLAEADAGLRGPVGNETVAQAAATWLEIALPPRRLRPATMNQYRTATGLITEGLGRVRLARLDVGAIDRFLAELGQTYSRSTVALVRKVLRQVLADAMRRGTITTNPADIALPATGLEPREPRALSEDEIACFAAAAAGYSYEHIWTVALSTGMRRGELLGLRWDDVDETAGTLEVRQQLAAAKGGGMELSARLKTRTSRRTVRIGAAGVAALRAQRAGQAAAKMDAHRRGVAWADTGLVFTTDTGNWIDPANHDRSFKLVLRLAGLDGAVTLHWFRHTHASHLVDNGVLPAEAAAQLGDTLETVYRVYYHATKPPSADIARVMDDLWTRVTER